MGSPERLLGSGNKKLDQGQEKKGKRIRARSKKGFRLMRLVDLTEEHHLKDQVDAEALLEFVQQAPKVGVLGRKRVREY